MLFSKASDRNVTNMNYKLPKLNVPLMMYFFLKNRQQPNQLCLTADNLFLMCHMKIILLPNDLHYSCWQSSDNLKFWGLKSYDQTKNVIYKPDKNIKNKGNKQEPQHLY